MEKCRRGKQKANGRLQRSSSTLRERGWARCQGRDELLTLFACAGTRFAGARKARKAEEVVAETMSQDGCVSGVTREWNAIHNVVNLRLRHGVG